MSARTIVGAAAVAAGLVGCGGSAGGAAATPDDQTEPVAVAGGVSVPEDGRSELGESPPAETPTPSEGAPGATLDNPVKSCGPGESYRMIASYECPDGSVPLGGDPGAGQRARLGSSSSHLDEPPADLMNSHIVDIYEVPCPGGTQTVHVCMYHCSGGRSPY